MQSISIFLGDAKGQDSGGVWPSPADVASSSSSRSREALPFSYPHSATTHISMLRREPTGVRSASVKVSWTFLKPPLKTHIRLSYPPVSFPNPRTQVEQSPWMSLPRRSAARLSTTGPQCRSIATLPNLARSKSPHQSAAKPSKPSKSNLDLQLTGQDPKGRIQFFPQRVEVERSVLRYGSQVKLDGILSSGHLIPFWTIMFLCDVKRGFRLPGPGAGWADNGKPRQTYTDIGCSIAAVADEHWCSGLVLIDDVRMMVNQHRLGGGSALQPSSKIYDFQAKGYEGINHTDLGHPRTPLFARSYPKLSPDELAKISTLPEYGDAFGTETWAFNNEPAVIAIPTYRPAYKIDLQGGRTAYVDGYYDMESSHQVVLSHRSGRVSSNWSWNTQNAVKFNARNLFEGFHTTQIARQPLLPTRRSLEFSEILLNAMRRNTLDWDDPNIIPAVGGPLDGVMLSSHADERIFGRTDNALPDLEIPRRPLFKPAPTASSTHPPPFPKSAHPKTHHTTLPPGRSPLRPQLPPHHKLPHPKPLLHLKPKLAKAKPRSLSDPSGYYRMLGVTPDTDYLDPNMANEILAKLSAHRRALAMVHHTDLAGSTGDNQMARINAAFDRLKTVELRRRYSYK